MILEREQIQRYMRHIIMPEIGGSGQKKLLDSSVLVCCEGITGAAIMFYYLAAMGIAKISCLTGNADGMQNIIKNASGLNPDLVFKVIGTSDEHKFELTDHYDLTIMFYESSYSSLGIGVPDIPVIFAAVDGACGYVRTAEKKESMLDTVNELKSFYDSTKRPGYLPILNEAYVDFCCILTSIEAVKLLLGFDNIYEQAFQYNLAAYEFGSIQIGKGEKVPMVDPDTARESLKRAKVLIVGSGGLGSPAAYVLARSGIGKLGLVDYDTVEVSNLNRQILHSKETIGLSKVSSAEKYLRILAPDIEICTYEQKFSAENAEALISEYDIVIDGLDNLPNRYLLNDACYFQKKPFVEAGVLRFDGLTTTIIPEVSPCYRCIFPESKEKASVPSCSETGVLGAVPGIMGVIQAIEAIRYLTGFGAALVNKILVFDALNADISLVDVYRSPHCDLCGATPSIKSIEDYEFTCDSK